MLLKDLAGSLGLTPLTPTEDPVRVGAGYASDLLSDVLANAKSGTLWVTNQKHQNVVGVAVMLNLAGVVIAGGVDPDENTLQKARQEGIPLYVTRQSMFELAGRLYELGLRSS